MVVVVTIRGFILYFRYKLRSDGHAHTVLGVRESKGLEYDRVCLYVRLCAVTVCCDCVLRLCAATVCCDCVL